MGTRRRRRAADQAAPASTEIPSYDPLVGGMHAALRSAHRNLYRQTAHAPSRWQRIRLWWKIRLQNRWLDYALYAVPVTLGSAAAVVFFASRPWGSDDGGNLEVVVGCASIVGIGGVVLAAVALPVQRAAEVGPGLTTGLLRRARVWGLGMAGAPVSVFMFWVASLQPDDDATLASSLLAGAAFGAYWVSARSALAAADSLDLAQAESKRLLKQTGQLLRLGERLARSTIGASLPRDAAARAIADQQVSLASGPIRMLLKAAQRLMTRGATDEAFMFFEGALNAFRRVLDTTNGAIGDYNSFANEIVEGAAAFAVNAVTHSDDRVASLTINRLAALATVPHTSTDVAEMRLHAREQVRYVLDQVWDNMSSRTPAAAAGTYAGIVARLIELGAGDDAVHTLANVRRIIVKGQIGQRAHVASPAMDGFIRAAGAIVQQQSREVRRGLLRRWTQEARELAQLKLLEDNSLVRSQDQLVPGIVSTGGVGLQEFLLGAGMPSAEALVDLSDAIISWLGHSIPDFAVVDQPSTFRPLRDGLALLLFVVLLAVAARAALSGDDTQRLATEALGAATGWLSAHPTEAAKLLTDPDVAEMLWSVIIAAGCLADALEPVAEAARAVQPYLDVRPGSAWSTYNVEFVVGVHILAGRSAEEADRLADVVSDRGPYGMGPSDYGAIAPLGRAPSCNRNATAHVEAVVDDVNAWAVRNFPALAT
ncbi:MAG: hypothetical protein KY443_04865 [Actinobacteria bacterium]|nr:hypothetical protein [Actinomycetota bacterium]